MRQMGKKPYLVPADVYSQNFNKIFKKAVVEPTRKANDIAMDKAEDKAEEEAEKHITNTAVSKILYAAKKKLA